MIRDCYHEYGPVFCRTITHGTPPLHITNQLVARVRQDSEEGDPRADTGDLGQDVGM